MSDDEDYEPGPEPTDEEIAAMLASDNPLQRLAGTMWSYQDRSTPFLDAIRQPGPIAWGQKE